MNVLPVPGESSGQVEIQELPMPVISPTILTDEAEELEEENDTMENELLPYVP